MANAIEQQQQEETPPFAMVGTHSPQHLFAGSITSSRNRTEESLTSILPNNNVNESSKMMMNKKLLNAISDSQVSSNSNPSQTVPGLVESVMTDGSSSSSPSVNTSSIIDPPSSPSACIDNKSPTAAGGGGGGGLLAWSLRTVSSDVGGSSLLPTYGIFGQQQQQQQQRPPTQQQYDHAQQQQHDVASASTGSYGFSQLLRAADDANIQLGNSRMPVVPEHGTLIDESADDYGMMHSGTLISSPNDSMITDQQQQQQQGLTKENNNRWIPRLFSTRTASNNQQQQGMLREPLLPPPSPPTAGKMNQSILRASPYEHSLAQAKTTINSVLEDDKSFEVSMDISSNDVSVQDIMNVLGNPDLLKLWCDPIESLIVTSTSDGTRRESSSLSNRDQQTKANRGREYEGEWIEATTTALESPPSAVGFIFGAGQSVLHTLGFASYGKITMFVERQRGKVGLTVGPFQGGIHANHTITVFEEGGNNGTVRLVDRVRLTHDEHDTTLADIFLCGACGACLDKCLLPPLGSYAEQVKTSMGRLRLLVDNERRAPGGATVITGGTLISVPVS